MVPRSKVQFYIPPPPVRGVNTSAMTNYHVMIRTCLRMALK